MTGNDLATIHAAANTRERPWTAAEFDTLLTQPGVIMTGGPHAFVIGRLIVDEAEILTLATHPDHRRQGLARAALTGFEDRARGLGAVSVLLEVAEDNEPAKALYVADGYAQIGRRHQYYTMTDGSRVNALVMRKALAGF